MFFKKGGKMKAKTDDELIKMIHQLKTEWDSLRGFYEKSVDKSDELLYQIRLCEFKYFFLLREAKVRNIDLGKLR